MQNLKYFNDLSPPRMVSQTMSDQLEEESRRMDERLQILRKMMSVEKARREYVCSMCLQNLALSTIHCGHRKQKWRMHGYGLNSRGGHSLASYPGSAHQEPGYKASHSQAPPTKSLGSRLVIPRLRPPRAWVQGQSFSGSAHHPVSS